MKHIGLKIIACIFGIALWFYVVSARVTEIDIQVPLVFTRLPETLAIASRPAQKITITVKGTAIDLIRLKRSSESAAKILVDLHDAELGLERIILSEDNFIAPDFPNIHYQSANQIAALEVEIDTRISRTIPVHLKGAFDAKDGYTIIGVPTPDPDTISISGAREALTRIFEIQTEEIKKQKPNMKNEKENEVTKVLTFYIGDQIYGIEIPYVLEIIGVPHITIVPGVPYYIKGIGR